MMEHDEARSPPGASLVVLHSWGWRSGSRWIDAPPFAELWQEVVGVCTADPLRRIRPLTAETYRQRIKQPSRAKRKLRPAPSGGFDKLLPSALKVDGGTCRRAPAKCCQNITQIVCFYCDCIKYDILQAVMHAPPPSLLIV